MAIQSIGESLNKGVRGVPKEVVVVEAHDEAA
jgi:hypothetical protein